MRTERGSRTKARCPAKEWWLTPFLTKNYLNILNFPQTQSEEDAVERSLDKNIPYGTESWQHAMVKKYGLEETMRGVGRPKNGG